MFRRQFRHLYEKEETSDLFYEEIFLDQNGYSQKGLSFETSFQDTIFTSNPPETFLTEVGKDRDRQSGISGSQIFRINPNPRFSKRIPKPKSQSQIFKTNYKSQSEISEIPENLVASRPGNHGKSQKSPGFYFLGFPGFSASSIKNKSHSQIPDSENQ